MHDFWGAAAAIRKKQIETERDITFCKVFIPYYKELLKKVKPKSILEVGCGTGHLSATLAEISNNITAIEPSSPMYSIASEVLRLTSVKLLQCKIEEFISNEKYDIIISHMVIQTISDLDNFMMSISSFMHTNSTFIFSLPHPCFYNSYKKIFEKSEYSYMKAISKTFDLTISKDQDTKIPNIPYNHRPISHYIKALRKSDMCLKDMDEIFPDMKVQQLYGANWQEPRYIVMHAGLIQDKNY